MALNNLIEDYPDNMFFLKDRKIFQINETLAPFYKSQIEQIGAAKIIILVDKVDHRLTSPNNKELLNKMKKAIESVGGEPNVIEIDPEKKIDWVQLKNELKAKCYILFGLSFEDLSIQANSFANSVIPFDSSYFLITNKLSDFHTKPDLKNVLWKKMKKMIEISKQ